jgi:hypothetical protein
LIVPIAGLLLGLLGLPLLVAVASPNHALPISCYMSCLVAALVWAIHFNSAPAVFLAMGIGYSPIWPTARAFWGLSAGNPMPEPPIYLWLLLVVAWTAIVWWLARLAMLHEEMDEYDLRYKMSIWDRSARAVRLEGRQIGVLQRKSGWRFTSWFIDRWHDQIAGRSKQGTASRLFLFRYGFRAEPDWVFATSLAFFLLVFISIFQALGIFGFGQGGPRLHNKPTGMIIVMLQFSVVLPAIWTHTWLVQRWPRLGQELLAAHSRENWIDGLLGALLRGVMLTAAIMQLAFLLVAAIWWPQLISPGSVVTYLLLVSGCVYLGAATAIWMVSRSRYRGMMGRTFIALLIMPLLCIFPLWLWQRETMGDWLFLLTAVVLGLAGWHLMRLARRRWLNVELGK